MGTMAKPSGKSTKKSGNTKKADKDASIKASESPAISSKKKSTNKKTTTSEKGKKTASSKKEASKEPKTKKTAESSKKSVAKKESVLKCKFCQKTMKDQRTLKIHERNCQTKKDDNKKEFETALIKIKDDFDDERQALEKQFINREDALQKEMDEMRTVLRMEIDRHRKELDIIRRVEKDVHEVAKKQAAAEPVHVESVSPPTAVSTEAELPPAIAVTAPSIADEDAPKAIDMIPMPLPEIPRKAIVPDIEATPEPDAAPTVQAPVKQEAVSQAETQLDSDNIPEPAPKEEPVLPGMSKEDIEELVKTIIQSSDIKLPAASSEIAPQSDELNSKLRNISGRLDSLDAKIDRFNKDQKREMERFERDSNIKKIEKEMHKISDKILDMMEDIGFGEDLSVSKIPPTILEIVYQATLDDIHVEIVRTAGHQDAETIARAALEEVRLKTSGSELFKFDGQKIVTDNLAKSIGANLISAKQIQTTYDVLLDRLLDTVPHHKAKNFRGMIKVKSQEFAVDRATILTKDYDRIEKIIESTSQMVAAISAQTNAKNLEFNEALEDIRENLLASKADREEIELIMAKMQERDEIDAKLADELALLKVDIEMKEQIKTKEEEDKDLAIIVPGETIDVEEIKKKEETISDDKASKKEKSDITPLILETIRKGASSKTAIIRDTDLEEDDILEAISGLVKEKKVIEKKVGKRIKYLTPELEMGEKIKADDKKKDEGKKETKKPEKKEPAKKEKLPAPKKDEKKEEKKSPKKDDKKDELISKKKDPKKPVKQEEVKKEEKKPVKKPKKEEEKAPKKKDSDSKEVKEPAKEKEVKKEEKKPEEKTPKKADKKDPLISKKKDPKEQKKEEKSEKKKPAEPKESHVDDELPVITKKLEDLSEDERQVLSVISREGMSISGIQAKAGKGIKRFALLRALRVLIDSGYVGIITKGRMDLYQKINVKKMDKMKQNKNKQEVKP